MNNKSMKATRRRLRHDLPPAERLLWSCLRRKQLGYKFRRQQSIGSYVVDFYAPSVKLAIELDGETHFLPGAQMRDERRDKYIQSAGVMVLRFTNEQVYTSKDDVLSKIKELCQNRQNPS